MSSSIIPETPVIFTSDFELVCTYCGLVAPPVVRPRVMSDGRKHLGAYCPDCGRWITWIKKPRPDWRSLPATERQVLFLARFGKAQPEMSRGAASDLISKFMERKAF